MRYAKKVGYINDVSDFEELTLWTQLSEPIFFKPKRSQKASLQILVCNQKGGTLYKTHEADDAQVVVVDMVREATGFPKE